MEELRVETAVDCDNEASRASILVCNLKHNFRDETIVIGGAVSALKRVMERVLQTCSLIMGALRENALAGM